MSKLIAFIKKNQKFIFALVLIFVLATFLRTFRLGEVPSGMHRDEGWFFYNAFLLNENGTNIYGEKWPLTLDFWGENVTASHSYYGAIFLKIFGHSYFAFRLTTVSFSLLTMILVCIWLYRLTHKKAVVIIFALLYAVSPWNIVMARASSTMLIDIFTLLAASYFYFEVVQYFFRIKKWTAKNKALMTVLLIVVYLLGGLCYLTYFSCRLLFIPLTLLIFFYLWWKHKWQKKSVLVCLVPILIYIIFPFLTFLNTPYARGRYDETTIINGPLYEVILSEGLTLTGQAGLPVWLARLCFNKVTVNFYLVAQQFVSFFSPSVLLFNVSPPERYFVPWVGALTWVEYVGFLSLMGVLLFAKKLKVDVKLSLFLLLMLGLSSASTVLTIDDFPNFQRGVMMTPFWQMAVAWGLYHLLSELKMKQWVKNSLVAVSVLSALAPFSILYYYISPHSELNYRNKADEEAAKWINAQAHDASILIDDVDYLFFYPQLLNEENIFETTITRFDDVPQYVISDGFQIGERVFIRDLCMKLSSWQAGDPGFGADYLILDVSPTNSNTCEPYGYEEVFTAKFNDIVDGYKVYQRTASFSAETFEMMTLPKE